MYRTTDMTGWSDWSTPCLIDSIPTPPAPPAGITTIETADLTLYPNPATHQVSIECAETISEAWLTDLTGRREEVRLTPDAPGQYTLDLTSRPQATYLLTLTTASGKTHTVRLLKQSDIFGH